MELAVAGDITASLQQTLPHSSLHSVIDLERDPSGGIQISQEHDPIRYSTDRRDGGACTADVPRGSRPSGEHFLSAQSSRDGGGGSSEIGGGRNEIGGGRNEIGPPATHETEARSAEESSQTPLVPEEDERLEPALETLSILAHLGTFAMLGVLIRYSLEVLFGPVVAHVTDDSQSLFLDVPANMMGSFLMGIVGYSSKKYIAEYSQPLAIGLSTGLCGSITTYASWNQRMIAILAYGLVVRSLFGYILGTAVAYYAFNVGVDAADGIHQLVKLYNSKQISKGKPPLTMRPENYQRRWGSLVVSVAMALLIWLVAAIVFFLDPQSPKIRKAALGCLVGPLACWLRWWLSWLNGRGVGKQQRWKWVPVGTLAANLLAVSLEAATSALDAVYNTAAGSLAVGGLQLGFMGCLSTVSTLMQEVFVLSRAKAARWRAYVYLYAVTFLPSITLGILVYCVPVWVTGNAQNGYNKV